MLLLYSFMCDIRPMMHLDRRSIRDGASILFAKRRETSSCIPKGTHQGEVRGVICQSHGEREPSNMEESRLIVAQNADSLRRFISGYMRDRGIGIQMVEAIAKGLFGQEVVQRRGSIPEET